MMIRQGRAVKGVAGFRRGLFFFGAVCFATTIPALLLTPEVAPPDSLPNLETILQKYVQALGGKEGLARIRTRRLSGELIHDFPAQSPPQLVLPAEVLAAAPDKWRLILKTSSGVQQMGFDGERGWLQDAERVRIDNAQARSRMAYLFHPRAPLRLEDYFSALGLQGEVVTDGRAEYAVQATGSGGTKLTLYFDAETGLLNRLGEDIEVKEYRRAGGVLHPVEIVIAREGGTSTYRFSDIATDIELEEARFAVPTPEEVFPGPPVFSVEDLRHDFGQLRDLLEKEHCCLYEYTEKGEFDRLFDACFKRLDRPMPYEEFFRVTAPLAAKVGCMHTALWMPGRFFALGRDNLFPLRVELIEDHLVVTGGYRDPLEVPVGSVILEVNGVAADKIFDELRAITSADALNPHFIDTQVEKRFAMFYASVFGFPETYTVTYTLPGSVNRLTADLRPADLESVRKVVFANFNHPPLTLEVLEDKRTAVMTVPTFSYYDRVDYFREFMERSFRDIRDKGITSLILDLRGNDGGDPFCAVILYSYLEKEPAPYFAEPYGKYAELAKPVPLAENPFIGQLFTLLDGRCGSTNGHFSALLRYHRIGKFVGTPSGATYICNGGKNTEIQLDKTGLILTLGRSSYAAAVKGMDKARPIMPDYPVRETYRDFLAGKDVYLEAALSLIGSQQGVGK